MDETRCLYARIVNKIEIKVASIVLALYPNQPISVEKSHLITCAITFLTLFLTSNIRVIIKIRRNTVLCGKLIYISDYISNPHLYGIFKFGIYFENVHNGR